VVAFEINQGCIIRGMIISARGKNTHNEPNTTHTLYTFASLSSICEYYIDYWYLAVSGAPK
jgi:hypothetical protein